MACKHLHNISGETEVNIKALGIDIAKNIFELHGVDKNGKTVLKKWLSRDKLPEVIAQLPPCLMGIEACGGSHTNLPIYRTYFSLCKRVL